MMVKRLAVVVACMALVGCAGPGAEAPRDASIDDFCAAKEWFVVEGLDRLSGGDVPPPDDALAELARDWARELTRVGTPENMSAEARGGFEKAVARLHDMEGGDVDTMILDWQGEDWQNDEVQSFAHYIANTCR
jgi:hypothetical protein